MTYFIRQGEDGPVKIGRSTNVTKRIKALAAANPIPLRLLGVLSGNQETRLHKEFAAYRMSGEWFRPAPEILAVATTAGLSALTAPIAEKPSRKAPLATLPRREPRRARPDDGLLAGRIAREMIDRMMGRLP